MYSLLRPLLFSLPAETSHDLAISFLSTCSKFNVTGLLNQPRVSEPHRVMGIEFPNRVGLAAGLDKDARAFRAFDAMGFGFIEVGTVTPRPQPGNPKPRMFRLPEVEGIINRMGFNNRGVDHLVSQIRDVQTQSVLGVNLGKNFDTPVANATDDYLIGMEKVYAHADYITINISSPNTPGLRDLQHGDYLRVMLQQLKQRQSELHASSGRYVPLAVKVAPDVNEEEIRQMAASVVETGIDGVIATNTTLDRSGISGSPRAGESGGLSGAPVADKALDVLKQFRAALPPAVALIGVGGIDSADKACERIAAGADLVQLYTGFIYKGPPLISACAQAIQASSQSSL